MRRHPRRGERERQEEVGERRGERKQLQQALGCAERGWGGEKEVAGARPSSWTSSLGRKMLLLRRRGSPLPLPHANREPTTTSAPDRDWSRLLGSDERLARRRSLCARAVPTGLPKQCANGSARRCAPAPHLHGGGDDDPDLRGYLDLDGNINLDCQIGLEGERRGGGGRIFVAVEEVGRGRRRQPQAHLSSALGRRRLGDGGGGVAEVEEAAVELLRVVPAPNRCCVRRRWRGDGGRRRGEAVGAERCSEERDTTGMQLHRRHRSFCSCSCRYCWRSYISTSLF
jgi:hypothetical protein